MHKVPFLFGLILAITIIISIEGSNAADNAIDESIGVKVLTSDELKEVLLKFPNAEPLKRNVLRSINAKAGQPMKDQIQYILGYRIRGDQRVAFKQHDNSFSEAQDVQLELAYPDGGGTGAQINYVQIDVDQTGDKGQAYVIRGGIGERYITLIVEAANTRWFNYQAAIFGQ